MIYLKTRSCLKFQCCVSNSLSLELRVQKVQMTLKTRKKNIHDKRAATEYEDDNVHGEESKQKNRDF